MVDTTPTKSKDAKGIFCPECGGRMGKVNKTSPKSGNKVQQRRKCKVCGKTSLFEVRFIGLVKSRQS